MCYLGWHYFIKLYGKKMKKEEFIHYINEVDYEFRLFFWKSCKKF